MYNIIDRFGDEINDHPYVSMMQAIADCDVLNDTVQLYLNKKPFTVEKIQYVRDDGVSLKFQINNVHVPMANPPVFDNRHDAVEYAYTLNDSEPDSPFEVSPILINGD